MVAMTETGNEKLITKIAVSIVALFLLVSWIPAFGMTLGDSHEGRVLGQFSLHMKNFWSMGVIDSSFGASWEPFSDIPYTHHPPVLTFLHVIVSSIIGEGSKQIKLVSYAAGVLTIPALFSMGKKSWNQPEGSDSFNPDFSNNTLVVDLWTSGFRAAT